MQRGEVVGRPLPQVREEVRRLHELREGVRSVRTASATGDNQGGFEALRQLRLAGGLCEAGPAPVEVVRERPLPAQGERVRNAKFAKKEQQEIGRRRVLERNRACLKRVKGNEYAGRRVKEAVKMEEREAVSA